MVRKPKLREFKDLDVISPLHKLRWSMHKEKGLSIEEIATEHGVAQGVIRQSINRVEASMQNCTMDEAIRLQVDTLRHVHRLEKRTLLEAADATIPIYADGKIVKYEPDHKTRLAAFDAMTSRLTAIKPPGKGVEVNQSKQELHLHAAAANAAAQHAQGKSFEDILRKIKAGQQAQLPVGESDIVLDSEMLTDQDLEDSSALEDDDKDDDQE